MNCQQLQTKCSMPKLATLLLTMLWWLLFVVAHFAVLNYKIHVNVCLCLMTQAKCMLIQTSFGVCLIQTVKVYVHKCL